MTTTMSTAVTTTRGAVRGTHEDGVFAFHGVRTRSRRSAASASGRRSRGRRGTAWLFLAAAYLEWSS